MRGSVRRRRWAETMVILGLCLMAVTAVSWADGGDPAPAPPPAATPEPTATVAPPAEATLTPTPTPEATATPAATPAAAAAPTASPAPSATPQATPTVTRAPLRSRARPQATPEPTSVPPSDFQSAALTLCHATGNSAQPYVAVTVPAVGYNPHFDHEDDIIPAPSSGCEGIDNPSAAAGQSVTVCHATGDADRPYVLLRYPNGDLGGHEDDIGDLIPAPGGTCPGLGTAAYVVPKPTTTPTATPSRTVEATATTAPTPAPRKDRSGTAGRSRRSDPAPAATAFPAATVVESGGDLPFTGLDLGLLSALGCGFVMTGSGLRLISRP